MLDFKETVDSLKEEDLVAFANTNGGTILVGVKETLNKLGQQSYEVVGCDISDSARRKITNRAATCMPHVLVQVWAESIKTKKPILRIDIPESKNKPHCTQSGKYIRRLNTQNAPIDPVLLKSQILEIEAESFVQRLKSAGDEMTFKIQWQLENVHLALEESMRRVEDNVEMAADIAQQAEQAAIDAKDAAEEARDAAERLED